MQIDRNSTGAVTTIRVEGRIDAYTAPEVETELLAVVDGGQHLVVDLASTDYISSAGLRVLITVGKRMGAKQLSLRLCGLQDAVREVFDIAGFARLFEIRDDCATALAELTAA